ncbi:MAG: hypothetical protein FIA97_00430, partial [Methylococcaceae bacterium]|nr:hypothetical protein [Methylococcaceae bacterium]
MLEPSPSATGSDDRPTQEFTIMTYRNFLALAAVLIAAGNSAWAETADEKAVIIQLDEAHKRSLRLTLVGDVDGLKQQV